MPITRDRFPGTRIEEELRLTDRTSDGDPVDERASRYVSGSFRLRDSLGVFNPRNADDALRIVDADGDTSITVEASADEDVIRFNLGNTPGFGPFTNVLTIDSANGFVWNDNGDDLDFRMESDGVVSMFRMDAALNAIAIGGLPTAGAGFQLKDAEAVIAANPSLLRVSQTAASFVNSGILIEKTAASNGPAISITGLGVAYPAIRMSDPNSLVSGTRLFPNQFTFDQDFTIRCVNLAADSSSSIDLTLESGLGSVGATVASGSGGALSLNSGMGGAGTGAAINGGDGGVLFVTAGSGGASSSGAGGDGGDILLTAGSGGTGSTGSGEGGRVDIFSGSAGTVGNAVGGSITIQTGENNGNLPAGNLNIIASSARAGSSGDGGSIIVTAGDGGDDDGSTVGQGGAIQFTSGSAGSSTTSGPSIGGGINFNGGDGSSGSGTVAGGPGGSIKFDPGSGGADGGAGAGSVGVINFGQFVQTNVAINGDALPGLEDLQIYSQNAGAIRIYPYSAAAGGTAELRFAELTANGIHHVGFKAPDSIAADQIWTLPATDGTTVNDRLVTDAVGNLSFFTQSIANIYDAAGGTVIPGAPGVLLPCATTRIADADYTVGGGGTTVTFNSTGVYQIFYSFTFAKTAGGGFTTVSCALQEDSGGPFVSIPGSLSSGLVNNGNQVTATQSVIASITSGTTVRWGAVIVAGGGTVVTVANNGAVSIVRMR